MGRRRDPSALGRLAVPALGLASALLGLSACFIDSIGQGAEGGSSTGGSSGDALGGQGLGGSGGGDGGGLPATCGDGAVDATEACDTGASSDGCVGCVITQGWECDDAEPSVCTPILPVTGFSDPDPDVTINDTTNHYDGTVTTMDCVDVVIADGGYTAVVSVVVEVAVNHPWLGDLIIKVVPPAGAPIATVMNRSGAAEPSDDYNEAPNGVQPDLAATHPVTFDVTAPNDAEQMGAGLMPDEVVCRDDAKCAYFPNPGAADGAGLVDLVGAAPAGMWRVCVADGDDGDVGQVDHVGLSVLAW